MQLWNVITGQLIGVREDKVLLPGFDDEDVDGLLGMLCCDTFDIQGLVTFTPILTLLFVSSFHIGLHSGVNFTCFNCCFEKCTSM